MLYQLSYLGGRDVLGVADAGLYVGGFGLSSSPTEVFRRGVAPKKAPRRLAVRGAGRRVGGRNVCTCRLYAEPDPLIRQYNCETIPNIAYKKEPRNSRRGVKVLS